MDYSCWIRFVDNSKKGDITPLLADGKIFNQAIKDLAEPFLNAKIDKVVGLESRGFIFAGAIAYLLDKGVIMIRKGGNLPCEVLMEEFTDYSKQKKTLEIARDAVKPGERVLIVDDWVETGSQAKAAIAMIERLGGIVAGIVAIVDQTSEEVHDFLSKYHYCFLTKTARP